MSTQVATSFADKFKSDFMLLSQQQGSRLIDRVRTDPDFDDGRAGFFDRIGATQMQKKTTRHGDTPLIDTEHSRRKFTREEWDWADLIDRGDLRRLLKNPQNSYVRNATYAANRNIDQHIIDAALGNAVSTDEDGNDTNVPLPAGQVVAAGGVGLTLAKLRAARKIHSAAEIKGEPKTGIVSAAQMDDLLNIPEAQSIDTNDEKTLREGRVAFFMGYMFVESELLPVNGSSERRVILFAHSGMGFAGDENPFIDIGPRRDKRMSTQVFLAHEVGSTQIEDVKVVEIPCVEV